MTATILVIDDDAQMRRLLRNVLTSHGYALLEAANVATAIDIVARHQPSLVLLDLGLPDGDGLEVIRTMRPEDRTPIIVLSARDKEGDKVVALDLGADDYLTKPFGVEELLARLRVALRHRAAGASGTPAVFKSGGLNVDLAGHLVRLDGREVRLTPIEFKLLAVLVRHVGKVVTHRQLLTEVWGPGSASNTHYLRVQMHGLRHKLEAVPARPRLLLTEPGVGYRLREEAPEV
jgi:two-component system, OmpR family, KDP operon response regulator KdpE